jgi:hypothetical protein
MIETFKLDPESGPLAEKIPDALPNQPNTKLEIKYRKNTITSETL